MATRSLRRLLRVLVIREEQAQGALAAALARVHELEDALELVIKRERAAREWFMVHVQDSDSVGRYAALEETASARRRKVVLKPRLHEAYAIAEQGREVFLAIRVERRQIETLIAEAEMRAAAEQARRSQQSMDDWYLGRWIGARERGDLSAPTATESLIKNT